MDYIAPTIIPTLIVGLVFLLTGFAKVIEPWIFTQHIFKLGLLPPPWVMTASYLFTAIECALGVALIFAVVPSITIPASILLLIGLSALTYWSTSTGRTEDCGCYNQKIEVSPTQSLILNGIYITLLIVGLAFNPGYPTQAWQWMLVGITFATSYGAAGGSFVYRMTKGRPFIDLGPIQAEKPWKAEWLTDEINTALNTDNGIIVFMSTSCPHCKNWLDVLKVVHFREDLPDVLGLMALSERTTPEQAQEFVDSYDLNFPVGGLEEKQYNKLDVMGVPTAVFLESGIIKGKWAGRMPEEFVDRIRAGDLSYPVSEGVSEEAVEETPAMAG